MNQHEQQKDIWKQMRSALEANLIRQQSASNRAVKKCKNLETAVHSLQIGKSILLSRLAYANMTLQGYEKVSDLAKKVTSFNMGSGWKTFVETVAELEDAVIKADSRPNPVRVKLTANMLHKLSERERDL